MPIDVDILEPPKKKSLGQKLLTGPKEMAQSLTREGETFPFPIPGVDPILRGLSMAAVKFPFEATKSFAQAKALYGPSSEGIATGMAVAPQTMEFARKPSIEQGSRAATELAQYALPAVAGKIKVKAKPKMTTVANDLKALGKPEVREKLPIKEKTFEELATMREEVLRKVENRRVETKPPEVERRVTERRAPEEQPPLDVAKPAEMTPEQIRAFADKPEQIKAFADSYGVKFDKYVPAKPYTTPKGKTVTDPPQYQFTDPQANNTTINITDLSELPAAVKHAREVNKPAQPVGDIVEITSTPKTDVLGTSYTYNLPEGTYRFRFEKVTTKSGKRKVILTPIDKTGKPVRLPTVQGDTVDKIHISEEMFKKDFQSPAQPVAPGGTEPPKPPPPVAKAVPTPELSGEPLINPKTFAELSPELKGQLVSEAEKIRPQFEKVAEGKLTNEKVLELAAETKGVIETLGRPQAEKLAGASEKLRQNIVRDLKKGSATPELQQALKQWVDAGTAQGQIQQARKISYDVSRSGKVKTRTPVPEWVKLKQKAIRKLQDLKIAAEDIQTAIDKVDWQNEGSVMDFNRKYSTKLQRFAHDINVYRYVNMLSDPRSPARNLMGNIFNAAFTRPAEMLGEAVIESPKALFGKERSTYFSQIPAYYKGLGQGVKEGLTAGKEVYQGKRAIRKPDLEREMSSAKILRPFEKATLGTLEATDLAVRETIKRAETLSEAVKAKKQGKTISPEEVRGIADRAKTLAEDLLYRSKIDWKNETGQGRMSSAFDAFHAVVKYAAEKKYIGPPTRLLQPFINIAIKIPKMGAQFTPGIGALDLIGGKNPKRIMSRQLIGGAFTTWAAMKALDGELIYRAPTDPEQKKAFYDQNKKEFSMKFGDQYVPLVYFGPFAFPMVLAGAVNHYFREDPNRFDKNTAQKVAAVAGAWVRYMSNQGVMLGLPVFLSELQEGLKTGTITNVAKQFWPLQGTQRWLTQLTDRQYRKPKGGFDFDAFLDQMQKDIPGLSQFVPPADATGPERPLPFMPYPITKDRPQARPLFEYRQLELEENAKMRRLMKEAGVE